MGADGPGCTTGAVMVMANMEAVLAVVVGGIEEPRDEVGVGVVAGSVVIAVLKGVLVTEVPIVDVESCDDWSSRTVPL